MPAWTEHDWDHERDSRKHDFPTISRLEPKKITTALEIAVLARELKNPTEAAALIDQYADMVAKCALADAAEQRLKEMQP